MTFPVRPPPALAREDAEHIDRWLGELRAVEVHIALGGLGAHPFMRPVVADVARWMGSR